MLELNLSQSEMAVEEEVAAEVEALQAVYGDDCSIMESNPPHLHLRLIPRTADLSSQQVPSILLSLLLDFALQIFSNSFFFFLQFVEAIIEIRAGSQVWVFFF